MNKKVDPYVIEKVSEIPPSKRPRTTLYSELIVDVMKREGTLQSKLVYVSI